MSPAYEERDLGLVPDAEALARARGKVESIESQYPDAVLIGADQLLVFDDGKRDKPKTPSAVCRMLAEMRGKRHGLHTALVVRDNRVNAAHEKVVVSNLTIRQDLTDDEITWYVDADRPMGCAGGYKLESRGICLFSEISTPDYTAILGLPLLSLCAMLRELGMEIPPPPAV